MFLNCVKDTLNCWNHLLYAWEFLKIIIKTLRQSAGKMNRSFHNHLLFLWAFLFFKTKFVTQVFITEMPVKMWKSLYIFKWIHNEENILTIKNVKLSFEYVFIQCVRILESFTRKVCEIFLNKHRKTIECIKN